MNPLKDFGIGVSPGVNVSSLTVFILNPLTLRGEITGS